MASPKPAAIAAALEIPLPLTEDPISHAPQSEEFFDDPALQQLAQQNQGEDQILNELQDPAANPEPSREMPNLSPERIRFLAKNLGRKLSSLPGEYRSERNAFHTEISQMKFDDTEKFLDLRKRVVDRFGSAFRRTTIDAIEELSTVSDLTTTADHLRFQMNGKRYEIELTELGDFSSISFDRTRVEYGEDTPTAQLQAALDHVHPSVLLVRKHFPQDEINLATDNLYRFEFQRTEDGKTVQYVVTPLDLLRLREPADEQFMPEWAERSDSVRAVRREFRSRIDVAQDTSEVSAVGLFDHVTRMNPDEQEGYIDKNLEFFLEPEDQRLFQHLWEGHRDLMKAQAQEVDARIRASSTLEVVTEKGISEIPVREFRSPTRRDQFERRYLDSKGKIKTLHRWGEGNIYQIQQYENDQVTVVTDLNERGKPYQQKRPQEGIIDEINPETGVVIRTHIGNYPIDPIYITASGEFGSFAAESKKDRAITEAQWLERFKEIVTTKSDWEDFSRHFSDQLSDSKSFPDSLALEIRRHGKDLLGITELEEKVEGQFGIEIELDSLVGFPPSCKGDQYKLHELQTILENIQRWLELYPSEFLENSQLKTIYVFQNWRGKTPDGEEFHGGGFSTGHGIIGITGYLATTHHHELRHQADKADGGLIDENRDWGQDTHGAEYASLYGKGGVEAIIAGTVKGPRPVGFVSAYARHGGIDEDQAETAELLLTDYKGTMKLASQEPPVQRAVERTKAFYYALSNGKMDSQFWNSLEASEPINAAYWENRDQRRDYVLEPSYEPARIAVREVPEILALHRAGHYPEAENRAIALLEKFPDDIRHLIALEAALSPENLFALYSERAEGSSNPLFFSRELVRRFQFQRDVDEQQMERAFQRVVLADPHPVNHEAYGNWLNGREQFNAALQQYREALEKGSNNRLLLTSIGDLRKHLPPEEQEEVEDLLHRFVQ